MLNSTYVLKEAIKAHTGWTDVELGVEADLCKTSLHNLSKKPDIQPNTKAGRALSGIYYREVDCPYTDDVLDILATMEGFRERLSKGDFLSYIRNIRSITERFLSAKNCFYHDAAGFWYILANTGFHLRFYLKQTGAPSSDDIKTDFEKARDNAYKALEKDKIISKKESILKTAAHKCNVMVFATTFMTEDVATRSTSEKIIKELKETTFLASCKAIIEAEPWNWMAARNGLVGASILRKTDMSKHFFTAFKNSHKIFIDLDYTPAGMPSINDDPDLEWFRTNIL